MSLNGNQRSETDKTQTVPHANGTAIRFAPGNTCEGLAPLATILLCFSHDVTDHVRRVYRFAFCNAELLTTLFMAKYNKRFVCAKRSRERA